MLLFQFFRKTIFQDSGEPAALFGSPDPPQETAVNFVTVKPDGGCAAQVVRKLVRLVDQARMPKHLYLAIYPG